MTDPNGSEYSAKLDLEVDQQKAQQALSLIKQLQTELRTLGRSASLGEIPDDLNNMLKGLTALSDRADQLALRLKEVRKSANLSGGDQGETLLGSVNAQEEALKAARSQYSAAVRQTIKAGGVGDEEERARAIAASNTALLQTARTYSNLIELQTSLTSAVNDYADSQKNIADIQKVQANLAAFLLQEDEERAKVLTDMRRQIAANIAAEQAESDLLTRRNLEQVEAIRQQVFGQSGFAGGGTGTGGQGQAAGGLERGQRGLFIRSLIFPAAALAGRAGAPELGGALFTAADILGVADASAVVKKNFTLLGERLGILAKQTYDFGGGMVETVHTFTALGPLLLGLGIILIALAADISRLSAEFEEAKKQANDYINRQTELNKLIGGGATSEDLQKRLEQQRSDVAAQQAAVAALRPIVAQYQASPASRLAASVPYRALGELAPFGMGQQQYNTLVGPFNQAVTRASNGAVTDINAAVAALNAADEASAALARDANQTADSLTLASVAENDRRAAFEKALQATLESGHAALDLAAQVAQLRQSGTIEQVNQLIQQEQVRVRGLEQEVVVNTALAASNSEYRGALEQSVTGLNEAKAALKAYGLTLQDVTARQSYVAGQTTDRDLALHAIDREAQLNDLRSNGTVPGVLDLITQERVHIQQMQAEVDYYTDLQNHYGTYKDQLDQATLNLNGATQALGDFVNILPEVKRLANSADIKSSVVDRDKLTADYNTQSEEDLRQHNERLASIDADFQRANEDAATSLREDQDKAAQSYRDDLSELDIKYRDDQKQAQDKYNEAREKDEAQHRDHLAKINRDYDRAAQSAIAARDAVALYNARVKRDDALKDESDQQKTQAKERKKDYDRQIAELDHNLQEQRDKRKRDFDRQLRDLKTAFDADTRLRILKYNRDIADENAAAIAQSNLRQQQYAAEYNLLAQHVYNMLQLQNKLYAGLNQQVGVVGNSTVLKNTIVPLSAGILTHQQLVQRGFLPYASGGRFPANRDMRVGEHGPEFVRFDRPGQVYTQSQYANMQRNTTPTVNVNATGMTPFQVGRELTRRLEEYQDGILTALSED